MDINKSNHRWKLLMLVVIFMMASFGCEVAGVSLYSEEADVEKEEIEAQNMLTVRLNGEEHIYDLSEQEIDLTFEPGNYEEIEFYEKDGNYFLVLDLIKDDVASSIDTDIPSDTSVSSFVEDFDDETAFISTDNDLYITNGKVEWYIERDGGEQFIYREIPTFTGDIQITVTGEVYGATNNCSVHAGVGDAPGSGVAVTFGYFGGGCSTNGYLVNARGADLEHGLDGCNFLGNWLWISSGESYSATLTVRQGEVELSGEGLETVYGDLTYEGDYTTLYVGYSGDGDWPVCSGTIDQIIIEKP